MKEQNGTTVTATQQLQITDPHQHLRLFLYEVCIPAIVLLCILAAFFNIAVFISRCYVKSRSTSLELTYSLALSDTWTSTVIAFSLFWNSYKTVVLHIPHKSVCFPLTLEAFRTGGLLTSIFHLVALAFVHYLQIVRPFDHARILSLRQCQLVIVMIWLLPPLSLIIYFSSWPSQGYQNESCYGLDFYENFYFRAQISLIIMVLMLITCVVYCKLLAVVNQVRSKTIGAAATALAGSWNTSANNQRGRRTLITACLIFGTFVLGWTPASVLYILTANGMPLYKMNSIWLNVVSTVVLLTIMLKTLTNPVIYATRIPEIRQFVLYRVFFWARRNGKCGRSQSLSAMPKNSFDSRHKMDSTQLKSFNTTTTEISTFLTA